jgi:hypothetical protein
MVIALFVVAFAMVVAGLAAIYDGYAIIALEKGWTKVISGTVAASAGFVLLGIVVAIAQIKRIGADLAGLRERAGRLDAPLPAPPQPLDFGAPPGVGEARGAGALGTATTVSERDKASESPAPSNAAEKPAQDAKDVATAPEARAPGLPLGPDPAPDQQSERAAGQSREERQAALKEAVAGQAPTVVGTYSSGGNTYIMYSDGSIRAETPTGLYRFDSLDELKAFIAAGGESVPPAR